MADADHAACVTDGPKYGKTEIGERPLQYLQKLKRYPPKKKKKLFVCENLFA